MTEHPGEQFPPGVDPDVEPGFDPYRSEEPKPDPDYDTEPGAQDAPHDAARESAGAHVDPAAVEFGPEFARAPGEEHEHAFEAGSAEDPAYDGTGSGEDPAYDSGSAEDPVYDGDGSGGDPAYGGDDGGHPLVEETMARLDGLRERPVSEHGEVYADLHERLQTALVEADAEQSDRG
ncbi:hypothetical protein JOF29_001886 [Kribbella aluminosa]|uniref:DUF5709 domain-containing protein n=1 Tax=Kribbella aluminosa TaxID=416017 RepID=A0ABS4UGP8_9ACTN|nr:hypothetical protein [Kribbella aluminosa]MBP2350803.1 hypothetical protein [Kribbella aluminosa]